jgi:hypothetical protein
MQKGCRPAGCLTSKYTEPVVVPPGGSVDYTCELDISRAGPFEFPVALFLEGSQGVRRVEQTVRGVARAAGESPPRE